jgi:hypothetical protein
MEARERGTLEEVAKEAARTVYEALCDAQAEARNNLFNARLKSDICGPELIKQREQELEDAKERLRAWATANPSTGYHRRFANSKDERQISELAAQIGAAAEAAVKTDNLR